MNVMAELLKDKFRSQWSAYFHSFKWLKLFTSSYIHVLKLLHVRCQHGCVRVLAAFTKSQRHDPRPKLCEIIVAGKQILSQEEKNKSWLSTIMYMTSRMKGKSNWFVSIKQRWNILRSSPALRIHATPLKKTQTMHAMLLLHPTQFIKIFSRQMH